MGMGKDTALEQEGWVGCTIEACIRFAVSARFEVAVPPCREAVRLGMRV
jgi:hypothetical protein